MFLSEKTSQAIDEIVGSFFNLNRTVDRMCSVLLNKWSMQRTEQLLHYNHAHTYPLLADIWSDFKSDCNIPTVYPETHKDDRDYNSLLDMMETYLKEVGNVYSMIKITYNIAKDEGDLNACAMIMDFIPKMTEMISQVITLRDKAEQIEDFAKYDEYVKNWEIDGVTI